MKEIVWALTAFFLQPAHDAVNGIEPRGFIELRLYDSRTECTIMAQHLKIHTPGATLRCVSRVMSPAEKQAFAQVGG